VLILYCVLAVWSLTINSRLLNPEPIVLVYIAWSQITFTVLYAINYIPQQDGTDLDIVEKEKETKPKKE
jgi:hypothetical protein